MASRIKGDLLDRTFAFALRVLRLVDMLPNNGKGWELGRQLVRSGTSIGANTREADNAVSQRDFVLKCGIARKEAAETAYWLALCQADGLLDREEAEDAMREADELTRILSAIVRKSNQHLERITR